MRCRILRSGKYYGERVMWCNELIEWRVAEHEIERISDDVRLVIKRPATIVILSDGS